MVNVVSCKRHTHTHITITYHTHITHILHHIRCKVSFPSGNSVGRKVSTVHGNTVLLSFCGRNLMGLAFLCKQWGLPLERDPCSCTFTEKLEGGQRTCSYYILGESLLLREITWQGGFSYQCHVYWLET